MSQALCVTVRQCPSWVKSGPLPSLRLGRFTPQSPKAGVARLPRYIRCVSGPDSCAAAKLRIQSPPRRLAAHYGSRVQYALRTERYACAASSNPFLDTAVNTTPTRNGLPSLSVSAVVATRSNGRPRRLGPLWVCSVVTGVVSCSVFTVARGVSPNSQRGGRGQTCGRIQSTGGRTEHAR